MKRSIIALLITFAFSIFLSGWISSNNNEDYYKLAIGERFWENRDGCVYKLNDYTLLQKSFSDKENDFIKRIDAENTDEDIVTNNTRFNTSERQFYEVMEKMNIPAEEVTEGLEYVTHFMEENPLNDNNRFGYWVTMAVSAYHAGKSKTE